MELAVAIIYSSKPLTTVANSSILDGSRRLDPAVVIQDFTITIFYRHK